MAIVVAGTIEYRFFTKQLAAAQTGALLSAAELQSNIVRRHLEDRRADALLLSSRERVRAALASAEDPASGALAAAGVQDLLAATHRVYGYHAVQLFDRTWAWSPGSGTRSASLASLRTCARRSPRGRPS
ncbi:MAG: hypothetical protein IPN17_26650 [Deltaproteobacteria bacterium]|nr:hypothetical protein [Deltaproteobacteria bacterium]